MGWVSFKNHVKSKIGKCYASLKQFHKLRPFLSTAVKIRLTDALLLSKFDYLDTIYGKYLNKKTSDKIQRIQNSCIRYCFKVPPRSYISSFLNIYSSLNMKIRYVLKLNRPCEFRRPQNIRPKNLVGVTCHTVAMLGIYGTRNCGC